MSWYTWTTTIYYRSTVTSTTTITSTSTRPVTTSQYTTDIRDMQYAVFPGTIAAKTEVQLPTGTAYYKNYYNLTYIKVVDLWNTTNILAFAGNGETRIDVKVDRPIGVAAVYTYDRTEVYIPPPLPSRSGPCVEIKPNFYCISPDAQGEVDVETPLFELVPCGSLGENGENYRATIVATTNNENCNGFITTVPNGPVPVDQTTPCDKDGNRITCELTHPLQHVIWDCDH
jgi:hypothetical protein